MNYLALYRKYRPTTFKDVYGQQHIIRIISNSLKTNHLSHAYLFYGPRGTGKTTVAKIIAKMVNCVNLSDDLECCNECPSCVSFNNNNNPDIIEMDAASNNGVDEIREIRDKINIFPSFSKYKVYIIDEVHMLSSGAFNALLKTLEEPPSHVIFILATTEYYKVPSTIVSRCQCFEFKKITIPDIESRLVAILQKENLQVDEKILYNIAKYSDGGMRDAISLLDKLICYSGNNITLDDFYDLKGISDSQTIDTLIDLIEHNNIKDALTMITKLNDEGKDLVILTEDIIEELKNKMLDNMVLFDQYYDAIEVFNSTLVNMSKTENIKLLLEINIIKVMSILKPKDDLQPQKIISREIISNNGQIKSEKLPTTPVTMPSFLGNNNISNNKLINDTLNMASRDILMKYQSTWANIIENLDTDFQKLLSESTIKAASEHTFILALENQKDVTMCLNKVSEIQTVLDNQLKTSIEVAFVTTNEWDTIKTDYIKSKKDGKNYVYYGKIISREIITDVKSLNKKDKTVDDVTKLFGSSSKITNID